MDDLLLRHCPFCGSKDAPGVNHLQIGTSGGYYHVWCNTNYGGCGAQSAPSTDKGWAIRLWNDRATDEGPECTIHLST